MKQGVDPKCIELADHFLQDRPAAYQRIRWELAEAIQDTVEGFLFSLDEPGDVV